MSSGNRCAKVLGKTIFKYVQWVNQHTETQKSNWLTVSLKLMLQTKKIIKILKGHGQHGTICDYHGDLEFSRFHFHTTSGFDWPWRVTAFKSEGNEQVTRCSLFLRFSLRQLSGAKKNWPTNRLDCWCVLPLYHHKPREPVRDICHKSNSYWRTHHWAEAND